MVLRPRAVEDLVVNPAFWRGRRVFVTGHTGFKGTWLTQWLSKLGAAVTGYSLDEDDVRDLPSLRWRMSAAAPEIVMHLAAQAILSASYTDPIDTFTTNVIGTVNVLESVRTTPSVRVAIKVTSDKCYANSGAGRAFREDDPLGGPDPYSGSKACAELAIAAYRESYFRAPESPRIISVRAGNVIGGGDWSKDRLVPDVMRAFRGGEVARIRNPNATRPWQYVLDALHGYLLAAERAYEEPAVPHAFNFGPDPHDVHTVRWLADKMVEQWRDGAAWREHADARTVDAPTLALDNSRAREVLGWRPLLDLETALAWTTEWYKSDFDLTDDQISKFMDLSSG